LIELVEQDLTHVYVQAELLMMLLLRLVFG
jgi:hypothetical protein